MGPNLLFSTLLGSIVVMLVAACGGASGTADGNTGGSAKTTQKTTQPAYYSPRIDPADFTTNIDNKYFPLKPGTTLGYWGKTKDATVGDVVAVTSDTKQIMGVECVVVDDKVMEDGKLAEQTYDWYAQDNKGNVWYFGEDSKEINNGKVTSTEGSWEAGKNGAKPGTIMPAHPKVGHTYRQEYSKGVAEDMARPLKLDGSASVPYGSFDHTLVTYEWTPLDPNVSARKYYAAGVGTILEDAVKGPPERLELVDVKSSERGSRVDAGSGRFGLPLIRRLAKNSQEGRSPYTPALLALEVAAKGPPERLELVDVKHGWDSPGTWFSGASFG